MRGLLFVPRISKNCPKSSKIVQKICPKFSKFETLAAFEGVLNFQDNLWTLVRDFCDVRQKTVGGIGDPKKSEISEEKSRSTRNYYVRKISFNYRQSYQLSVALSKMQSLVKVLKVSFDLID